MHSKYTFGICFSRELSGNDPLGYIGEKLPVYIDLLRLLHNKFWNVYVLSRKTYEGNSNFKGGWLFDGQSFNLTDEKIKADVVYDRTGGLKFPVKNDNCKVVNSYEFKKLAWNKWEAFQILQEYMPTTFLIKNTNDLIKVIDKVNTEKIVIKPVNGLQGMGVFIGSKENALKYDFSTKYSHYIAQGFIDTSDGIKGITGSYHDLRIVVVNKNIVWSHVRIPPKNSLLANAAQGGELREISIDKIPVQVKEIVSHISDIFYGNYSNPIYSLDFGIDKSGIPKIFEINDQIGFPKPEMKNKDAFLHALVENFSSRI